MRSCFSGGKEKAIIICITGVSNPRPTRLFCAALGHIYWWGNLRERDHWEGPDADGRIILRWIFRKWEGVVGTGWIWFRTGTGGGLKPL